MTTALILLSGLAMIFINIPIAVALGGVSIIAMLVLQGANSLLSFPIVMFDGATKFPLIAIPLFILAGAIMKTGGIFGGFMTATEGAALAVVAALLISFRYGELKWSTLRAAMVEGGVLAAGGQYALAHHVERLTVDHDNARLLAEELATIDDIEVHACHTNMVFLSLLEADCLPLERTLASRGIRVSASPGTRLVTNLGITADDIRYVTQEVKAYFR
ncbi:TRAP transporter large permease subunit [Aidingimonas lacisalsi]|uniref:TRAP transporter large permease subunit n=1 Tax=Aidingimonas lacisalsi TaxID=2604086 RepID=UPI0011D28CFC|nr:TRAP transporter large permease subunit [Aidingimonas lacisalsi]